MEYNESYHMASAKIAITIPEDVLSEVDAAARERGESRSGFISRILRVALTSRRDAAITRRLNEVFADESVIADQERITRDMDAVGSDWTDEGWE